VTSSKLDSLGEVMGAFELIVTIVFVSMEMRLGRQAEAKYRPRIGLVQGLGVEPCCNHKPIIERNKGNVK